MSRHLPSSPRAHGIEPLAHSISQSSQTEPLIGHDSVRALQRAMQSRTPIDNTALDNSIDFSNLRRHTQSACIDWNDLVITGFLILSGILFFSVGIHRYLSTDSLQSSYQYFIISLLTLIPGTYNLGLIIQKLFEYHYPPSSSSSSDNENIELLDKNRRQSSRSSSGGSSSSRRASRSSHSSSHTSSPVSSSSSPQHAKND